MASFSEDQRAVHRYILIGITIGVLFVLLGYFVVPIPVPKEDSLTARLVYTLRWQTFPAIFFIFTIQRVGNARFFSAAINPMSAKGDQIVDLPQRILRNTHEQVSVHFIGQLVLSTYLTAETIKIIPVLVCLFVFARIIFWIGYNRDPLQRAVGYSMTFLPTIFTIVFCVFCFFMKGPSFLLNGE